MSETVTYVQLSFYPETLLTVKLPRLIVFCTYTVYRIRHATDKDRNYIVNYKLQQELHAPILESLSRIESSHSLISNS